MFTNGSRSPALLPSHAGSILGALAAFLVFAAATPAHAGGFFSSLFDGQTQMPGVKTLLFGGAIVVGAIALFGMFGGAGAAAGGGFLKSLFSLKGVLALGAVVGGGLLVKSALEGQIVRPGQYGRYDRTFGQRYQDPYYSGYSMNPNLVPRVGAGGVNFGQRYGSGNPYLLRNDFPFLDTQQPASVMDQIKMTVSGGSYVPSSYYGQSAMYGGYNGGGYGGGGYGGYGGMGMNGMIGSPYLDPQTNANLYTNGLGANNAHVANGNAVMGRMTNPYGYMPPEASGATDRVGRVPLGQDARTAANRRAAFSVTAAAPAAALAAAPGDTLADASEAVNQRNQAYDELLSVLADGDSTGASTALEGYRTAHDTLQGLAGEE